MKGGEHALRKKKPGFNQKQRNGVSPLDCSADRDSGSELASDFLKSDRDQEMIESNYSVARRVTSVQKEEHSSHKGAHPLRQT